ncbi:MAG: hypothetical protein KZQ99_06260 [Candidatus Thiodiazotropha sp. (ex Dulcina madagascariensis)]|nr:hypothetical protein [Candidatus Thiodiazotropha sp. (ex Dulcina madagascariensis)]
MSEYDPTILSDFTKEITSWPDDQAAAAVQVVRNVIEQTDVDIDQWMDELTVHQMEVVTNTIKRIMGDA